MKKTLLAFMFLATTLCSAAQRVYFIYMQSEKSTPFFVKMGEKVLPSNPSGYLILHSLKDSTYAFTIGYPGGQVSEARFNVTLSNSDRGFLIKQMDEGLSLFDLQSLNLVRPVNSGNSGSAQQAVLRTDNFTILLSQVSDDASLMRASAPLRESAAAESVAMDRTEKKESKDPPAKEQEGIGTAAAKPKELDTVSTIERTAKEEPGASVLKADSNESKQTRGEKEVAATANPAAPPTTQVEEKQSRNRDDKVKPAEDKMIVEEKPKVVEEKPKAVEPKQITGQPSNAAEPRNTPAEADPPPYKRSVVTRRSESSTTEGFGLVFLDNSGGDIDTIRLLIPFPVKGKQESPAVIDAPAVAAAPAQATTARETVSAEKSRGGCQDIASDRDFLKLRRSMAAENNDERMVTHARKYFRAKCFSTEQVRNLSALFLTSAAKYQFFDAAFGHVTDAGSFAALGTEIKDEYYARRFKALIGE
jgi:hypothetical protein